MHFSIFTKHKTVHTTIICFILFAFACSSAPGAVPTLLPVATTISSLTFTDTPAPTRTLRLNATPSPSMTPTLTPLVTNLGQVIFSESFDDLIFPFNVYGPKRIEAGVLVLDVPKNGIFGKNPIPSGVTTVVLFRTEGGTIFDIGYHAGEYNTESLRRISYNSTQGTWDIYIGEGKDYVNPPAEVWKDIHLNFNTWHYFSITRTLNGEIIARIWERDNPKSMIEFQRYMGEEWGRLEFTFFVGFQAGSFLLDEYQELK